MKCLRCHQESPPDAAFCPECGSRLATVCAKCGAANAPTHRFCKRCGSSLAPAPPEWREVSKFGSPDIYTPKHLAEKILSSKSALEGERKQVTVLFADLKGSMELLADRDPEEARNILDPVLELMMEAVHRYEGTVNQVMGDGIMALFGAPVAHEDHAVRACYAALRIQESVKRNAEEVQRAHGIPIHVRVGLNSGDVVVRSIGSDLHMDYTAVGQTTHLAARMEQMAMPGSILVTADCWRAAEGYVQSRWLGPLPVKGLSVPIEVHELTGAGAVRTRLQVAATRGLTRFTGREAELTRLHTAFELAEAGRGQVVAVIGEPGVGKSRLLHEFARSERTRGWLVLETASVSYGRATPYLPVIDLLRAYFRIESQADHSEIREKVVGKLFALDRALEPALPAVLALLDVPVDDPQWQEFDPSQRRRLILDAVKRLLLHESQAQPLLLVFEDLHAIDSETQALLNGLVDSIPTAPVLLVVSYRPEYQHRWGSKSYYTQLRIDPLPAKSAESFLSALIGEQPALRPLRELLIERTGGNPFFLEECVRTLVETGVLTGVQGAYRVTKELQTIDVPATVQAVLAARIDRLRPDDKRLLQSAAVIGRDVPLALLKAIEELPEETVRGSLARLQAAEFLYEVRLFPELEYTFKHALTQEVAYGALLQERRRILHGRIVEALECSSPSGLAGQVDRLAHHAVYGELWAKAVTYLHQAGLKATARSASREAVACVEQALEALSHLVESPETIAQAIDLRFDLHSALIPLGDLDRVLDVLSEAKRLAEVLRDQHRLGRVSAYMATCLWWMGEPDAAVESGERARAIAASLGDTTLEALTAQRLGQAYATLGEHRRAIDILRRHVERPRGEPTRERFGMAGLKSVTSRAWMAWCFACLGEFTAGIRAADEAVRIAEAVGDPYSLGVTYAGAGLPHLIQGNLVEATSWFERSVDICRRASFMPLYLLSASYLGQAYTFSGRIAEALELLERVTAQSASIKVIPTHAQALSFLSEAQLLAGRRAEALESAESALRLIRVHRQRFGEPDILRVLADLRVSQDPPEVDQAEGLYTQALTLAREMGLRPLVARCRLHLGRMYAMAGKRAQGHEHLTSAKESFRDMQMRSWLEKADAAMKEWSHGVD